MLYHALFQKFGSTSESHSVVQLTLQATNGFCRDSSGQHATHASQFDLVLYAVPLEALSSIEQIPEAFVPIRQSFRIKLGTARAVCKNNSQYTQRKGTNMGDGRARPACSVFSRACIFRLLVDQPV